MYRVISIDWTKKPTPDHYVKSWPKHCPGCLHFEAGRYNYSVNRGSNWVDKSKEGARVGCKCGKTSKIGRAIVKEKENDKIPECMICTNCGAHHPITDNAAQIVCPSCDSKERLHPKYLKEGP